MSTRSAIFIEIDRSSDSKVMTKKDGHFVITPDINLLPEIADLQDGTKFNDVVIDDDADFLAIYCQHDGDETGDILEEYFPNYDQLLSLAALGNCSAITDDKIDSYAYSGEKPEPYENNKPKQISRSFIDDWAIDKWYADYAYVYRDGEWEKYFVDYESNSLMFK